LKIIALVGTVTAHQGGTEYADQDGGDRVEAYTAKQRFAGTASGDCQSSLSKPFRGATTGRPAMDAARDMLQVINKTPEHSGMFYTYGDENYRGNNRMNRG
jgi:hypothetical protein